MNHLKPVAARIAFALPLLMAVFAAGASAQPVSKFQILMDLDNHQNTGCNVTALTGTIHGVERILTTTVNASLVPPQVTKIEVSACTGVTFGPPTDITPPGTHPVGMSNGTGGTSVIETFIPASQAPLGNPPIIQLYVLAFDNGGVLRDEMLKVKEGNGNGPPILMQAALSIAEVPTLSEIGLLLLGLLLALAAVALLRRRSAAAVMIALLLLGLAGVAWAAAFDLNGNTTAEWTPDTLLATESTPDAPAGTDIRALFGARTPAGLYFRIDALLQFNSHPMANPDSYTTVQDTTLNVPAPGVLGNDTGGGLTATPQTAAPTTQGGTVTLAANGSFTYNPPAGFAGTDTFTYTANNILGSANGTVTITVTDKPPVVTGSTPANGATGVAVNSTITVNFSEPVNVTASAFKLECPAGTPVPFTIAPVPPGGAASFVLTPSANLPASTTCTVTVVAAQVTDVDHGTHPTADTTITFSTDVAPTVTATSPASGATKVPVTSDVTVTFSEPVNVTGTAFKLECPTGTPVAFTVSPASPATTFTLHPTSNLPGDVVCTVTVVASQVTDVDAGTHLGADYVFSFTTNIPPTVSSTTPANGATSVALSSDVTVVFSESVNVTGTAFKLECPTGTPVAFTVSPASPSTTFTLHPTSPLPPSTTCTLTVVASQVTDVDAGSAMQADKVVTFTTDTPPTVTSTTPTNGATGVAVTSTVTINFSESVNVTGTAFKLECPTGTPVAFTVTPASPATSFVLHPTSPLPGAVTCTVTVVASQVTDVDAGTKLQADDVFTFTTDAPPSVSSTSPANGATNVAPNTTITINFSEQVNVTGTAFKLECPMGTPVAFTVTPVSPASSFVLHPTANLPTGVVCTVTVVANQVTDTDTGQNMTANDVFSFTTDLPPSVSSTSPANGATNVAPNTTITINFSEPVNVTGTAFKLECPTGTPVGFTVTPASPATSFVLHPTANLPTGVVCTVTVVANQVTDTDTGQNMTANDVFSFTTDLPPSVSSTVPANGATGVSPAATVTVNFSEPVNVTGTAFKLECPTGTPVGFTVTPASPAASFVLHPTSALPPGVTCTATVQASQVTDVDVGQNMASDYVFSFTIDLPPSVTSTVPTNGATGVALNATVTVNFSEPVNVTGTAFKLECPTGTPVGFTVTPASPAASFVLHPTSPLPASVTCTATVQASQVTDVDTGQNLPADYSFSFTTDAPPTVTSTVPTNGATTILPTTTVTVNFSEPVNVTGTAFTLECPTGTPIPFTVTPASPASSFVLHPTSSLPTGVTCTVTVVASQVTDVDAGQNLSPGDYVFTFDVDSPPSVTSTVPANGATGVAPSSTVTVNFSESVNVTPTAFKLECPTGTPVAFSVTTPSPATSFVLQPTSPLPSGVVCTVTVVAAQVTDVDAGQTMTADFTASFTVDAAPTVASTVPTNGATSVSPSTTITINFSEQVNVTGTAFKLECPAGTPVAFTASASPASSFVLTPTSSLPAGVTCKVTVVASQVTDTDVGQNMAADYMFTFTTDTPPSVTTTVPANGATNVTPGSTITINFSEPVNVTGTAFKLECPTGTPVAFTVTPASPASSFVLHPTSPLPGNVTCTVTVVASQVTDVDLGQNMTADYVFSFGTDAPPTVTSTVPVNGATAVLPTATITINFSEPVNVTGTAFKLECPTGTPKTFTVTPASPASSFVLHPTSSLPAGTTCTVTVVAAQVTDVDAGQNLSPGDYVFSFTINTLPTVTSTVPTNGATGVDPATTVTVNFSEPVNVTGTAFKLECPTGTPKTFTVTPASPASSFVLHPTSNLPGGTTCTVTVVAAQVTDVDAGQNMAANFTASFTTDPPPTVSSVVPANGTIDVALNATVTVTFSESVNVTGTAFKLECPTGTPQTFTVSPASPSTSFVLTPTSPLPGGAVCTVTVVANQVTDVDFGQNMTANFTSSFTVDSPPTVTSTVPTNGATGVATSSTVTINFSKSVSVTGSAFTLQCPTGTPVTFTVTPASPATSYVLHPSPSLPAGVICSASVVASQVTDSVGTAMAANYNFSFSVPPVAVNDTYPHNVIGHVSVNSALIPYSVTTNDISAAPFTITAFDATTVHGGTVSMTTSGAGMGQFTYNPPVGYTGPDSFTYTISNAAGSTTGTVSLTVSGLVWFINNGGPAGDGRLSSPLNSLAAFQAINDGAAGHGAPNHNIFIYESGTDYTGPVTLLAGQKLIGQDSTSTLSALTGLTPGASSAAFPATNSGNATIVRITSAGNTVTLGSNNEVHGLTLGNSTGTALTGTSFGTLKIRDVTINTTGSALSLTTGTLDAILKAVTAASGTHGIALTSTTGSLEVTGDGASDPANTTRGRTTAKNGGGTITLGSGGTISGATSAGVLLSNAANVTLRNMTIQNNGSGINTGGDGITWSSASGLTLDNVKITGHGGNFGLHGTTVSGLTLQHCDIGNNATTSGVEAVDVWNIRFDNLTGTATVSNSLFDTSRENIFGVKETGSSTATMNVTNCLFQHADIQGVGNDGISINAANTSNVTLDVESSSFFGFWGSSIQYVGNDSSGGGLITVHNCVFDSFVTGTGANGTEINISHQGLSKTLGIHIDSNQIRQSVGGNLAGIAVLVGSAGNASTTIDGTISNNLVGNSGVANSGSANGNGIVVEARTGVMTVKLTGNTVRQVRQDYAVWIKGGIQSSGAINPTMNVTINGSNDFAVGPTAVNALAGLGITMGTGAFSNDSPTACLNMSGNTAFVANVSAPPANQYFTGLDLTVLGTSPVVNLQGYGGAANNASQINTFLQGTATTINPSAVVTLGGTSPTVKSGGPCTLPTF